MQVVTELSRAFALCAASDEATAIRDDVSFFQAVQSALTKQGGRNGKSPEAIDAAVRQLVSRAITTEGQVIDVFTAAGLPKPDISILSEQFLAEARPGTPGHGTGLPPATPPATPSGHAPAAAPSPAPASPST